MLAQLSSFQPSGDFWPLATAFSEDNLKVETLLEKLSQRISSDIRQEITHIMH